METVSVKIALPDEVNLIAEIGRNTFYETWREVNTEEDMQLYLKKSFNEKTIGDELSDTVNNLFFLARKGEQIIGYAKVRRDRTYEEFNGVRVLEIERIYVKREMQNKKVGKMLMYHCIEVAKAEHHQWLWLAVNTENLKAINFYKKYGFEVFGTKFFKLGNAEDQDFLMKLKID